ncbi:MAG: hypothetical protein IT379_40150, partial [Deltaproteobacteria bacterium]|nr:hypothetical protein [Deltaproteobacteria bacterium]
DRTGAFTAIGDARGRLVERAQRISDEEMRGRFLHEVSSNRRTLELAARWLTS